MATTDHTFSYSCRTEQDTDALAAALAPLLQPGDIVLLDGDLGAGKTRFVQGVAAALGIREPVTSPTFTIHVVYQGELPINHFDLYRLDSEDELDDIGYWEVLEGDGASFVEWADKFPDSAPADCITMNLSVGDSNMRTAAMSAHGPRSAQLLDAWEASIVSAS